jgi:hypothetical protein
MTKFIRNGSDSLTGASGNASLQHIPSNTAGRRAGWRLSR